MNMSGELGLVSKILPIGHSDTFSAWGRFHCPTLTLVTGLDQTISVSPPLPPWVSQDWRPERAMSNMSTMSTIFTMFTMSTSQKSPARGQLPASGSSSREQGASSWEPGTRSWEPGARRQELAARRQEAGARRQEPGAGSQDHNSWSQKASC